MPKRSKPIVTGAAPLQGMPVRKRKKLVKQQKERLEQGLDDDSEDAQEEPPMALDDADEVEEDMEPEELAVVHDPDPSARAADGRTIALSPDKSDKAARFSVIADRCHVPHYHPLLVQDQGRIICGRRR